MTLRVVSTTGDPILTSPYAAVLSGGKVYCFRREHTFTSAEEEAILEPYSLELERSSTFAILMTAYCVEAFRMDMSMEFPDENRELTAVSAPIATHDPYGSETTGISTWGPQGFTLSYGAVGTRDAGTWELSPRIRSEYDEAVVTLSAVIVVGADTGHDCIEYGTPA